MNVVVNSFIVVCDPTDLADAIKFLAPYKPFELFSNVFVVSTQEQFEEFASRFINQALKSAVTAVFQVSKHRACEGANQRGLEAYMEYGDS